jgi:hypothetical protein
MGTVVIFKARNCGTLLRIYHIMGFPKGLLETKHCSIFNVYVRGLQPS